MLPLFNAYWTASSAHFGQTRKGCQTAYFVHPCRVAQAARHAGLSEDAQAAAYLHDVVEDTRMTFNDLMAQGFNGRTLALVRLLTKWWPDTAKDDVKAQHKPKYYAKILADQEAVALKLLDRADNLADMARVLPGKRRWVRRYVVKTEAEFGPLYATCENWYARREFRDAARKLLVALRQHGDDMSIGWLS